MSKPLVIDYYTDILCIWAWIAQKRIDELNQAFENRIEFDYHYVNIFGDVDTKMQTQWQAKGGYVGFAQHVQESAAPFENAPVNPKLWIDVQPATSANAHLVLKAIEAVHGQRDSMAMALVFRQAFFVDALDISKLDVLYSLINAKGLSENEVVKSIGDGSAMAKLMSDYQTAQLQGLKGSPSYVMDGGRQTLYGNVGYRVLLANIEELLKNPGDEASWC